MEDFFFNWGWVVGGGGGGGGGIGHIATNFELKGSEFLISMFSVL